MIKEILLSISLFFTSCYHQNYESGYYRTMTLNSDSNTVIISSKRPPNWCIDRSTYQEQEDCTLREIGACHFTLDHSIAESVHAYGGTYFHIEQTVFDNHTLFKTGRIYKCRGTK